MADENIAAIINALRDGQWSHFARLVILAQSDENDETPWAELAQAHGTQFDVFERLLAWPKEELSAALEELVPVVGRLPTISLGDGIRFLRFAERAELSFRYRVAEQLVPHIAARSELGSELGDALRRGDAQGEGATRVWAGAFSGGAPEQAAQYAVGLASATLHGDAFVLATLVQFLQVKNPNVLAILGPHEAKLATGIFSAASSVGVDAWHALAAMADFSMTAMNVLHRAAKAKDLFAARALAHWLYGVTTPTVGATDVALDELLRDILHLPLSSDEIRQRVDPMVASLLRHSVLRPVVMPCVADLGRIDTNFAKNFPRTLDAIWRRPEDFSWLLTRWLLEEGIDYEAVRSLLSKCSESSARIGLDAAAFQIALPARKLAAVRRIMSLTFDGGVLCRLIASLAETPEMQPAGLELSTLMLNEAFAEYPTATVEFLKVRTRPPGKGSPFAHVYRGVYANALKWRRVLARLPDLNELRPSDSESYALRAMKQRLNRDVMSGAKEKSIFASFATQVYVAQGRRFATHTVHGEPQIMEMQMSSHAFELPSSEWADPVGGALRRTTTLGASR